MICVDMCGDDQFADIPEKNGMRLCTSVCGTRAFAEVVTEKGSYKQCIKKSACGRFVPESMFIVETEQELQYKRCYGSSCPESHQYTVPGNDECYSTCPGPDYLVPLSGYICVTDCGDYQIKDSGKCVCARDLEKNSDETECVLPARKSWKNYSEVCAAEGRVVSFAGDQCTDKCPENEKL